MKNQEQYRHYLQNQRFNSNLIPSNSKLRVYSQPKYLSQNNPSKSRQSSNHHKFTTKTTKPVQNSRTSFTYQILPNHEPQKQQSNPNSYIGASPFHRSRLANIQIPYDTEQLNKNVSKVLTSIQQIQSEFRKVSNHNSFSMKQPSIDPFQEDNSSNFIQELMAKIKKPINYQQKTFEFIQQEKTQLVKLIKNLNKKLNQKLKELQNCKQRTVRKNTNDGNGQNRRRIKTQFDDKNSAYNESRVSSALEFEKSFVQAAEEVNANNKLIENMKHELQFLNNKHLQYQHSLKNHRTTQNTIAQMYELIKKKKQDISRMRKNKFLNEKAIITIQKRNGNVFASNSKDILSTNCSTSTHSGDMLASLKEEFTQLMKKKHKLNDKIELTKMHLNRIEELKEKNLVNKEHFDQLAQQMKRLSEYEKTANQTDKLKPKSLSLAKPNVKHSKIQSNQEISNSVEHIEFIYKTKKSRLQMLMNTIKRTEQALKKKYFNLLKQYEAMVDHTEEDSTHLFSPSPNKSRSPPNAPIIKIYNEHEKMIDDKLDKAKEQIQELQIKIQRMGKIGKITKKINQNQQASKDHSSSFNQTDQDYDVDFDKYQENQNNQSPNNEIFLNRSSQSSFQLDFGRRNSLQKESRIRKNKIPSQSSFSRDQAIYANEQRGFLSPIENPASLQRMYSGDTSHYQTPSYLQNEGSESGVNKRFMTEDQRSFTSEVSLLDKNVIRYQRRHAQDNKNNRKYIGKFKKQRILQKSNFASQSQPLIDTSTHKHRGLTYTIIQEQIEGTSEHETSELWSGTMIGNQQDLPYQQDDNDQDSVGNHPIEEELQRQAAVELEMQRLERELEKQQKEEQMKQKFSKMLFKNALFSS